MGIFVKIDCDILTDDKIIGLSPGAAIIYIKGICYAGKHLTDGYIPRRALPILAVGVEDDDTITELLEAKLWEECEGGWRIPFDKWSKYQSTRAEVEKNKALTRDRMAKMRTNKKGCYASVTHDVTHDVTPMLRVTDLDIDIDIENTTTQPYTKQSLGNDNFESIRLLEEFGIKGQIAHEISAGRSTATIRAAIAWVKSEAMAGRSRNPQGLLIKRLKQSSWEPPRIYYKLQESAQGSTNSGRAV